MLAGLLALAAFPAACDGRLELPWDGSAGLQAPRPEHFPVAGGSGVASPTPTPLIADYGSGAAGFLTVAAPGTIVNQCVVLASTSGATLTVSSGVFAAGDRVLVIQMKDAQTTASGDAEPITSPEGTGLWDLGRVLIGNATGTGGTVRLENPLQRSYGTNDTRKAQVCLMPEYTSVNIDALRSMVAPGWNGSTGGVVGIFVRDTLDLRDGSQLSAAGGGYLGGAASSVSNMPATTTAEDTAPADGGGKGGGLRLPGATNGRGNLDVGAGGGNARRAGGGGGGGAGAGGFGGMETNLGNTTPSADTRGRGGVAAIAGPERLLMGGGGGGGHQVAGFGSSGGDGGGIVLVFARRLKGGTTGIFNASGANGNTSGDNDLLGDGAGGGGGGGTILIVTDDLGPFPGAMRADGGPGGIVDAISSSQFGPGGGGGGGRIFILRGTDSTSALLTTSGGIPGSSGSGPGAPAWGASNGAGGIEQRLPLP